MNHRIIVQQPKDDTLGSSILKLLEVLRQLDNIRLGDTIVIDITKISFATPVLILPLSSIIANLQNSGHEVTIHGGSSYLQTVLFPNGFNALSSENWADSLNYYRTGTYLPICQIPAGASETGIRDRLLTVFGSIMLQQLNITGQSLTAIRYLISETMDNIVEHAGVSNGWIMVQNYPSKCFLDICILDRGVWIRGSYVNNHFGDIPNDQIALRQAINGQSTKQIAEKRGYGINTSRRMLVDGIKGKFFLFSGSAFYIYTNDLEQITPLERFYSWKGTMLALRVPRDIPANFDYTRYLE